MINRLASVVHLTIVHTYHLPTNTGTFISYEGHFLNDAEAEMNRVVNRIQPLLGKDIVLQTVIKRGDAVATIGEMGNEFDLVIMGTQGASGLKEIFLGSITNGILKKTTTPVLAIPEGYEFKSFKNVVLSVDNNRVKDEKGVQFMKKLLKAFKANLMLFHTEEQAADRGFDKSVIELFDNPGYSIDFNSLFYLSQQVGNCFPIVPLFHPNSHTAFH